MSRTVRRLRAWPAMCLWATVCGVVPIAPAQAGVTVGGDAGEVVPSDPSTWTSSTTGRIGVTSGKTGSLSITGGSHVSDATAYIGKAAGATGTATVTGLGSSWTTGQELWVGYQGNGSLSVGDGAQISSVSGHVGGLSGSVGSATVQGANAIWNNTQDLYVGVSTTGELTVNNGGAVNTQTLRTAIGNLQGNGTINAKGVCCDRNLVFDSATRQQAFPCRLAPVVS